MPTIIDSLIVTLGLDGSAYTKGVDAAITGRDKISKADTAGSKATVDAEKKRAGAIQNTTKVATEGYRAMSGQLLGILGILGTIGAGGFLGKLASANVQLDTNAKLLGMSTQQLYGWKRAADALGGSGDDLQSTLQGINSELNDLSVGKGFGERLAGVNRLLQAAGMTGIDLKGKSSADIMALVQQALSKVSPQQAQALGGQIGLSGANILALQNQNFGAREKTFEAEAPSASTIEQSRQLKDELTQIETGFESLANTVLQDLGPDINKALKAATDWWAGGGGKAFTQEFEKFLTDAVHGVEDFGAKIKPVVDALGGWKQASEDLFGLWLGIKAGQVISRILGVGTALAGGGVELLAASVALAPLAIAAYEMYPTTVGKGKVDEDVQMEAIRSAGKDGPSPDQIAEIALREGGQKGTGVNAKSGAQGPMQVLPGTAHDMLGYTPDANDWRANTKAGALYLTKLYKKYGGDWDKTRAAYNWGPGHVDAAISQYGPDWKNALPDETRKYISPFAFANGQIGAAGAVPPTSMRMNMMPQPAAAASPGVTITNHNTINAPTTDAASITQKLTEQNRRDTAMARQYGAS
jgi:uncharacterized protein YukE